HHPPPTAIYTLSLPDALPISCHHRPAEAAGHRAVALPAVLVEEHAAGAGGRTPDPRAHCRERTVRERRVVAAWPCCRRLDARCRSEEHTSELQSRENLVCRLL